MKPLSIEVQRYWIKTQSAKHRTFGILITSTRWQIDGWFNDFGPADARWRSNQVIYRSTDSYSIRETKKGQDRSIIGAPTTPRAEDGSCEGRTTNGTLSDNRSWNELIIMRTTTISTCMKSLTTVSYTIETGRKSVGAVQGACYQLPLV